MIDRLESEIRDYRIEFQRFLNGEATIPPEEMEAKLRKRINEIVGKPQLSPVDRFRLTGLESRFNSLTELFRRRQRGQQVPQPHHEAPATRPPRREVSIDLAAGSESRQVERLYEAIYAKRSGEVGLDEFHAYLSRRAEQLRQKTGCDKVRFTVHTEDGKPRLSARGIRSPAERGDDPV